MPESLGKRPRTAGEQAGDQHRPPQLTCRKAKERGFLLGAPFPKREMPKGEQMTAWKDSRSPDNYRAFPFQSRAPLNLSPM